MGFSIQKTAYSGDGGVDIIAYCNKPVFRGKYLIQCKHWNEQIGQPVVRDMFGVTISEGANKGIVITTSSFTEQAEQFAKGKNIELIGRQELEKLFQEYGMASVTGAKPKGFLNSDNFEKDRYEFYFRNLDTDKKNEVCYKNLYDLLDKYVLTLRYEGEYEGVINAYIDILQMENRYRFNTNKFSTHKVRNELMIGLLNVLKGDYFGIIQTMILQKPSIYNTYLIVRTNEIDDHGRPVLTKEIYNNLFLSGIICFFTKMDTTGAVADFLKQRCFNRVFTRNTFPLTEAPMTGIHYPTVSSVRKFTARGQISSSYDYKIGGSLNHVLSIDEMLSLF